MQDKKYHTIWHNKGVFVFFAMSLVSDFLLCDSNKMCMWVNVCVVCKLWKVFEGVCMCIFECVV